MNRERKKKWVLVDCGSLQLPRHLQELAFFFLCRHHSSFQLPPIRNLFKDTPRYNGVGI